MMASLTNAARLLRAVWVLSRHDALIPQEVAPLMPPVLRLARKVLAIGRRPHDGRTPGERLALAFQHLGPAYIKLGQTLATRPDIVGDDVAEALKRLQDRLPPFPQDVAEAVVEAALGQPVHVLFSSFGPAIAAASIAQVHRAETNEPVPRPVAVKIARPGIAAAFRRDLAAFAFAAAYAERFSAEARRLRVSALVQTLATSVELELDLRMEAAAASELTDVMADDPDFRIPTVDWARTAEHVLTLEWIDGISARDVPALKAAGHDPRRIAVIALRSFLDSALRFGFFHADMHQGNLFVDPQGRLVAVDFGIMGRLDHNMRRFMAVTLQGFLARDYRRVADVHFEFGFVPAGHSIDTFAQALRAIGEPIFGRSARDVSMARVLQQLFDTTRRFDMELQPQLVLLQKTMVVVEGVARSLDPDFDIWEASRPVIAEWMAEQIGPAAMLKDAQAVAKAFVEVARDLPATLRNIDALTLALSTDGLRLHVDSLERLAKAQSHRIRHLQVAIWIGALGLLILAIGVL